jgi:hypothetical protein
MIADKLAQAILQCGINYFNDSNADDAPEKALRLQNYALSIAVGQMAKDRCKENVDVLKNIGPEYKVRNQMNSLAEQLKRFNSKSDRSIFAAISGSHTITEIGSFVDNCKADLQLIKAKIGSNNSLYLKVSSAVASAAINALVETINAAQHLAQFSQDRSSLRSDVTAAVSIMSKISSLDMTSQCRTYFNTNNSTLNSINAQLNPSGGCYIATMVYGDYDHPQVMVLRDFRDSYLDKREWGKRFIKFYYKHSPNWVEHLKSHHKINRMIQACLDSFIFFWKKSSNHE